MIVCVLKELQQADKDTLTSWLGKGALPLLLKVIDSQVKKYQIAGLRDTIESDPSNRKEESAQVNFLLAKRFQNAHDVISELASGTLPFEIATLS